MSDRIDILALLPGELEKVMAGMGHDYYRARQVFGWIYQKRAASFDEMTSLSQVMRTEFGRRFTLNGMTEVTAVAGDAGTKKYVFRLSDGLVIESVLMMDARQGGWTACVSSQVGCPVGCAFCLTGKAGFRRSLSASEIIGQLLYMARTLPAGERVSNVVFMGMGEPLLNYDNVVRSVRIMTAEGGLQISPKKITISTAGIPSAMGNLGRDVRVNLALSLSATTDGTRNRLIPLNKRHPIRTILSASRRYPLRKMLTVEYVLLNDINDTLNDARTLVRLLKGLWCKVNLIPYNPVPGARFNRPSEARIRGFQRVLLDARITAIVRKSKGEEIMAACGQLGAPLLKRKR